jgi:MFS family permease
MIGRKPVIIIGLVGYFFGTLAFNGVAQLGLLGVASGVFLWALLMLSRVVLVAVMAATQPAATAYVVDVTPIETRTKGMSRLSAANQIGTMVGPALAYFAGISFLAPLYIQATICVVAAVLVWRMLAPVQHLSASRQPSKKLSYLDPRIRVFLAVGLVMFTMMGMVQQTLGFYFQDKLQLNGVAAAQQFSKAMVVSSIMMLVSQFAIVQRWRGHPVGLLKYGLPVAAAGYVCMAMASSLSLLMAGMALFGLGMGMATPGYSVTATYAVSPQEQGALAGLSASAPAMGFVIGPVVGGLIYGYQASLTYWLAASMLIPLAVYCAFLKPNH